MPEFIGNFGDILTRSLKTLNSTTPIRQNVAGSKARALLEVQARELENIGKLQDSNLQKAFLATTYGKFLEYFGSMVGLQKYPQRNAAVLSTDRAIRFSTRFGTTFGEINGGEGFTIPAGTLLTAPVVIPFGESRDYSDISTADSTEDRSIHYSLTSDLSCSSSAYEAFASAEALTPGSLGNLAASSLLKTHNFSNYSDYNGRTLVVTNSKPILNGTDSESEASYKYRISKKIISAQGSNNTAMILAALSVPGVADVIVIPYEDGPGRFNVYIKSITPTVPDILIQSVQDSLDKIQASGCKGYARKPFEIGIEIDSNLIYSASVTTTAKVDIRSNAIISASRYLNNLGLGQVLDLGALSDEIKAADGRVLQVGLNPTTGFDAVFAYYPARLETSGRRREKLIVPTLAVPSHARITVEQSVLSPIRLI
jgi:uncharacterized phage protein gp47/JayE